MDTLDEIRLASSDAEAFNRQLALQRQLVDILSQFDVNLRSMAEEEQKSFFLRIFSSIEQNQIGTKNTDNLMVFAKVISSAQGETAIIGHLPEGIGELFLTEARRYLVDKGVRLSESTTTQQKEAGQKEIKLANDELLARNSEVVLFIHQTSPVNAEGILQTGLKINDDIYTSVRPAPLTIEALLGPSFKGRLNGAILLIAVPRKIIDLLAENKKSNETVAGQTPTNLTALMERFPSNSKPETLFALLQEYGIRNLPTQWIKGYIDRQSKIFTKNHNYDRAYLLT